MKTLIRMVMLLLVTVAMSKFAAAEKAPLSLEGLTSQANAIVIATIEKIRIEVEPSYYKRRRGNSDWGIYLTLRIHAVEKGDVAGERLVARCFRIKSRNSRWEYLTPSGHHPIPEIGSRVRVYLDGGNESWRVVLPNGIASVEHFDWRHNGNLNDAPAVKQLVNNSRELPYTLEFPYPPQNNLWKYILFSGIPMLSAGILFIRWLIRTRTGQPVSDGTKGTNMDTSEVQE